jgi:glycosyltransferase involved in cell wall biosynthesis
VVVPSVRDAAGDRDGLPNVVLEALAAGRAVVASDIAAVGTAVRHDETGLLVPPGDARALAAAIERVASSAALRSRLAAAGRVLVEREFDLEACTARLAQHLEAAYA